MYAIEFEAGVHDNTIKIPSEYKGLEAKHLKVFIVEIADKRKKLPDGFSDPISVTNYKDIAKRDELYDRQGICSGKQM